MQVLGLMSGTSLDAIDLAVIDTDGVTIGGVGPAAGAALGAETRAALRLAAAVLAPWRPGQPVPSEVVAAEALVTAAHEAAIAAFLAAHKDLGIALIGFHGQTILHRPELGFTWQLGDPQALADRFRLPVVGRFRVCDVAAGGQGAPFVPLYHQALVAGLDGRQGPVAVVNLGGVANVTWIAPGIPPLAFDTGPANALLDDWALVHTGQPVDRDGRLAAAGRVDPGRLARLLDHPFFARPVPKSLDRDDFSAAPLAGLSAADGAATLAAFTVESLALALDHMPEPPGRWLIAGGGRHNPVLMAGLAARLAPVPVASVEAVGWRGDWLEAEAFGFLAARSLAGLPLSLPTTTGVGRPMPGGQLFRPSLPSR